MPHVITENCILCRYGSCVDVCPVVCFHEGPNFMVIDPVECVDCGICVDACEANAIFPAAQLPPSLAHYQKLNESLSAVWPLVMEASGPLTSADAWNGAIGKWQHLVGAPKA
ncbi:ferredoxin family protein [Acidithiobacillus ferriphilus]|nr:ferredoxin family protein [Acidithiobacillus ferriphilus]